MIVVLLLAADLWKIEHHPSLIYETILTKTLAVLGW